MKRALRGLLCSVLPAETSCHAASPTQPGVVVVRPGCTCGISTQHTHHSLLFIPLFIITVCALVLHEHGALRPPAPCMTSPNTRYFTNKPEHTVYSGPTAQSPSRITLRTIAEKHKRGERISMVTAYDYPSAVHVCKGKCVCVGNRYVYVGEHVYVGEQICACRETNMCMYM